MVLFDFYMCKFVLHSAAKVRVPFSEPGLFSNSRVFRKDFKVTWIFRIMPSGTHTYVYYLYVSDNIGAVSPVGTTNQDDEDLKKDKKVRKTKSTIRLHKRKKRPPRRSSTSLDGKHAKLPLIIQEQAVKERAITPQVFKILS